MVSDGIVLATGPPLNGRDEFIRKSLEVFENDARYRDKRSEFVIIHHHFFKYLEETASERGFKLTRRNVLEFAINSPQQFSELKQNAFEQLTRSIKNLDETEGKRVIHIVSTPSYFKWNGYRVEGLTEEMLRMLNPSAIFFLIDDILNVRQRIIEDEDWFWRFQGKEELIKISQIAEWREDAIQHVYRIKRRLNKQGIDMPYVLQLSVQHSPDILLDLILRDKEMKKIYLSYPMTGQEDPQNKVKSFYLKLRKYFIAFDPGTIKDWNIINQFDKQMEEASSREIFEIEWGDKVVEIRKDDIEIAMNILRKQIVDRDFNLVDASSAIAVYHYVPEVSAGVVSEMAEGIRVGCYIYAYYPHRRRASPFMEYYFSYNPSHRIYFDDEDEMIETMRRDQDDWLK